MLTDVQRVEDGLRVRKIPHALRPAVPTGKPFAFVNGQRVVEALWLTRGNILAGGHTISAVQDIARGVLVTFMDGSHITVPMRAPITVVGNDYDLSLTVARMASPSEGRKALEVFDMAHRRPVTFHGDARVI